MLILVNEDSIYLRWVRRHPTGFVLDATRHPRRQHVFLHRSSCAEIRSGRQRRKTTGGHMKLCSLDRDELLTWCQEATGEGPTACPICQPLTDAVDGAAHEHARLSKLAQELLDYLIELATVYLDDSRAFGAYRPLAQEIADYLEKSLAQVSPALRRLTSDAFISVHPNLPEHGPATAKTLVVPTARALREFGAHTALAGLSDGELQQIADRLQAGDEG